MRMLEVTASYGNVPIVEFDALRAAYDAEAAKPMEQTFREDYEFTGAGDGEVTASYKGACSKCGLEADLNHSVTFWSDGEG